MTDEQIIRKYLGWCIAKGMNQSEMARVAQMTKGWASMLVHRQIKSLNFATRNRLKQILGIQDQPRDAQ